MAWMWTGSRQSRMVMHISSIIPEPNHEVHQVEENQLSVSLKILAATSAGGSQGPFALIIA